MEIIRRLKRRWGAQKRLDILHERLVMDKEFIAMQRSMVDLAISYTRLGKVVPVREVLLISEARGVHGHGRSYLVSTLDEMKLIDWSKPDKEE